eukprot:TRINITY_DN50352_c0_g1_i1.p1 TRINITY_DN50352_c0_g1~~TRINITY_DN50352_c0_g1_i1.p1  ORF type:complete len:446 (-),score=38.93 TRINITY_DN50352_c0_g1_i1:114-1451(-)
MLSKAPLSVCKAVSTVCPGWLAGVKYLSTTTPSSAGSTSEPASGSHWSAVPLGPPDAILGLTTAYKEDTHPSKVNVGVGAYRDDDGQHLVLESVHEASRRVLESQRETGLEYIPISGLPEFVKLATEFVYGDARPDDDHLAAVQSLSGTGALCIGFNMAYRFSGARRPVFLPNPTWGNHAAVVKDAGLTPQQYRYLGDDGVSLDFGGLMDDVMAAPEGSIFLLHACAHNPTGVDPTPEQWKELSAAIHKKQHIPFFDNAYQGFASGDADKDAFAVRQFVRDGHRVMLSQSFAKNFGLYGERVGTFSMIGANKQETEALLSQLKLVIRPMYSSPPAFGARIVSTVLGDPELSAQWYEECAAMAERIANMRSLLRSKLEEGSDRDWSHVTNQIGMFCYSGLSKDQVAALVKDHHIYMTADGRISMAGVNMGNVDYIADCIHKVTSSD